MIGDTNNYKYFYKFTQENIFNKMNENKTQVQLTVNNCSYCNRPFAEKFWCKECDPRNIIEGWTSGNYYIDKFIKDTIYDARHNEEARFLGWVPFDRFTNIKEIGEGGFAKVYA